MLKPLTLIVQEMTETTVTLKTPDGHDWHLPLQAIHGSPKIGQEVQLIGVAMGALDAGESAFAKTLLNEILNSSSA